ncbi:GNAT family N-acetyltransferase [Streptomyces sp. NPDC048219]|uniref:GNAT family N-acetyltransferase n=1 Tax=Streptomyces sp. NPDC048219 TaxID=3365517 RepID=UPI00371ECB61
MELQTDRLLLSRPTTADVEAIFAVHRDPETCVHNPSDALARIEEAEALYRRWDAQWQQYGYGYWVRRHGSAQQLGFCGIKPMGVHGAPVLDLL